MRRRWRVKVQGSDAGRLAIVFITKSRWATWYGQGVIVAEISLKAENADEKLSEARATARHYANQIQELEAM